MPRRLAKSFPKSSLKSIEGARAIEVLEPAAVPMAETMVVPATVVPTPEAVPLPEEEPTAFDTLVDELAAVTVAKPAEAPTAATMLLPMPDAEPEPAA